MNYRKIMLVALVLLAVLTLGAVSAADVDSDNLTVDDVGESDFIASSVEYTDLLSDVNGSSSNNDPVVVDGNVTVPEDGDDESGDDEGNDGNDEGYELETIWVDCEELSLDDLENHFAYVNTREDVQGHVIVNSGENILFNNTLRNMDHGFDEQGNYYWHGISLNHVNAFDGLNDEDMIVFSFFDENNQKVLSRIYFIYFGENTIRLENDDSENLDDYTTVDGLTFSLMENMNIEDSFSLIKVAIFPEGIDDDFSVSLQKEGDEPIVTDWNLDTVDRDRAGYAMWNLEQLGIVDVGEYSINFIFTIDDNNAEINVGNVNINSEGEGNNHVEFWINTEDWFLTFPGELNRIFATVTVPEGSNGFVALFNGERELYKKNLNDFDADYINGTTYYIALEDDGNFIFDGMSDDENYFRFAFLDEDGNDIAGMDYFIFFGNGSVRFEADAHNPGDHVSIDVSGEELSTDDENDFVWINLPSYITEGKVIVTSGDYTLFEETVNFDEGTHWWREIDDHYVCSFAPNSLTNLDKLNDGDSVFFAFLDENGDEVDSKEYAIALGEDTVRFEEVRHMEVNFWDENDERGTLYTDSEGWVVNVDVIDGSEGTIFIIVNGDEENPISWDIEREEWEDFPYHEWYLQDLRISQAGEYDITVKCNDKIVGEKTINVALFNYDAFRVYINYENENIRLFCPENSTGTVEIIIQREDRDGNLYRVNENDIIHEITSDDYAYSPIWYKEDLEIENGELYYFTISITNSTGDRIYTYSQWFSFGDPYDDESFIGYHGTNMIEDEDGLSQGYSEIVTYDDGRWKYDNFFSFADCENEDKTIRIYVNDNHDWDFPEDNLYYTCDLYDLIYDGDFYILPVGNLNLATGEHYVHVDYNDDWRELIITLYSPQIAQNDDASIEINPSKTIIKDDDCFVTIQDYANDVGNVIVLIDNSRTVTIPLSELRREDGSYVIGSRELGITEEKSHTLKVTYNGLEVEGEINPISNVEIGLFAPIFEKSIVIGYGHDLCIMSIFLRDGNVRDLNGTVKIYLNDDETPALTIDNISKLELDSEFNSYRIYHSQIGVSPETTKITVKYSDGNEADVSASSDFNFTYMTPDHVWVFTEIEVRDNVYSNDINPITIIFDGNPQSQEAVFESKYVLYLNGEKIDKEFAIFYPKGEGAWDNERQIYDINDPMVQELKDSGEYDYDVFNWLSVKYLHWCSDGKISLSDLNITSEGKYEVTIKFTGAADGADELEIFRKNFTYEINPDYAAVEILKERIYKNGQPFLITFDFGDNVLSESNRILVYLNDQLAFNGTTLFWEENDEGEMELVNLWELNDGQLNEYPLNEYGVLDVGEYEAVVYLVKGDADPIEIGRDNFTVMNQKGNMSFEMESSVDEWDDVRTVLYVDIPEGDWEGYSLSINIADSEEFYPDEDDGFARWYDEYVIFKDDEIYFKDSLDNIIGKGRVAIDLGVLDDETHIWVVYGNGEETVFNGGDFYQYDFTVQYPARAPGYYVDIDDEVYVDRLWNDVISIHFYDDVSGTIAVLLDGKEVYNTTLTGHDHIYIEAEELGFDDSYDYGNYTLDVIYSGDEDYLGFIKSRNVTLTYRFSVYLEHEYDMSGFVYGRKILAEVYAPYDETSKITYVLNGVEHEIVFDEDMGEYSFYLYPKDMIYGDNNITFKFVSDKYPSKTINRTIWNRGAIIPSSLYVEYGEPINFELALPEDAKGTLNIYSLEYDVEWDDDLWEYVHVNETFVLLASAPVENGLARIVISDLDIGSYTIYANYTGNYDDVAMYLDWDEEYWHAHVEPNLNVPNRIWANGSYTVEFKIPQKYNGVLNVTIGEDTISCNVINGSATFELFNIDATESGEWDEYDYLTIYYSFADDENGIEYSSYKSVNVLYVNPQFQLEIGDYEYQVVVKDLDRYSASFYMHDEARGNITVYLDDEYYDVVDVGWGYASASIEVDNLTVGKHDVRFEYSGDGYFVPSTAYDSFNVTNIDLIIPDWVILGKFHDGEFDNGAYVKALDDATGEAKLIIDGVEIETKAIYGGETKFNLSNLTVGNHTVTLIYNGNYGFLNKTSKVEAGYSYFLDFSDVRYGGYADAYFPIGATGEVTATIDGKEFRANIDEMGIARFHIEGIVAGEHEATVSYAGNDKYPADSLTFNMTVYYAVIADFPYEIYESDLANYAIELTLPENATGKLVIYDYFDDEPFMTVNLTDGKAKITLADLVSAAGGHGGYFELLIGYDGDDYDDVRRSYSDFTVVGHKIVGPENAGHVILGDTVEYTVQFSTNLTGRLRVYDGDRDDHVVLYDNITIKNGVAKFSIEASTFGSQYYELEYVGDDYELRDSVHFIVWPENVTLTDKVSNDDVILAVKLPGVSSGNLTVIMLSDKHGRLSPIVNYHGDVAAVLASDMPAGKWTLVNFIIEDEKYGDFYFSSTSQYYANGFYDDFRVIEEESKMPANLTVSTSDINVGDVAVIDIAINENVTGKVTVNGIEVNMTNGAAKYEIKDLAAGDYTYTVKFAGDDKFTLAEKTVAVKVSKLASDVNVTVGSAYNVGDSFTIAIANNTAAVVTINGKIYAIKDGKVDIDTTALTAGSYTVVANITEGDKYLASSDTATFTLSKAAAPAVVIDVESSVVEGTDLAVEVTVAGATGTVIINGEEKQLNNSKASAIINNVTVGDLTISVAYSGDAKYLNASNSTTVNVFTRKDAELTAVVADINVGEVAEISITINKDVTGKLTVNGEEVTVVDGTAKYAVAGLTAGNHTFAVKFAGDKYFNAAETTVVVKVSKVETPAGENPFNFDENKTVESKTPTYSIDLPKDATGTLTVTIDGKNYTAEVKDGKATVAINNMPAGSYDVTITYSGDDKYSPIVKTSKATVKVDPRIDAKDAKVQYTAGKYYSVTVYGDDGKVAPKGTQVIFTLNGKQVSKTTTNANGVAKFKVTQVPVTNAKIVAKALGVTATKKLTITHAATLKTVTVKKSAKKITLKVTVKVNGKAVKNKVVKFKFNNKNIKTKKALKTDKKGVATVDVPTDYYKNLKVGKTVTYQVTYLKDTVKKSTKVKA